MIGLLAGPLAGLANNLIDRLFETDEQKANAKARLIALEQQGQLDELQISMSAIIEEARSKDPWTSRARPTFMYIMYFVILLCFAGGIVGIWFPEHVKQAAENIKDLLNAIPESLWWLFGAGYLGYTGARSFDKYKTGIK